MGKIFFSSELKKGYDHKEGDVQTWTYNQTSEGHYGLMGLEWTMGHEETIGHEGKSDNLMWGDNQHEGVIRREGVIWHEGEIVRVQLDMMGPIDMREHLDMRGWSESLDVFSGQDPNAISLEKVLESSLMVG